MKILKEIIDKEQQKKTDPAYQKAIKLKKLTVIELEKLLSKVLEKENYIKLSLDKPVFEKQVIVPFTIQDSDSNRKEYDSVHKLQKIIKRVLEETNWRLMSEGVIYRLGYLSGRLKGYEQEEELVKLIKSE